MNKNNWKEINYPSKIDDWNRLKKTIQQLLLIFFILKKEKKICAAYISKINSNCEKQIILLMIPSKEKEGWHYLALKNCLWWFLLLKLSSFLQNTK